MVALNFPDTPVAGDTFGSASTIWRWDGTRWASTAGTSGARGQVAFARVTAQQSGITNTVTNLTGLSVTFAAEPSRTYRTTLWGESTTSVAGDVPIMNIRNQGGTILARSANAMPQANVAEQQMCQSVEFGLSGSQTRYGTLLRAIGTGTLGLVADPTFPAFIQVEDITYEAGLPAGNFGDPAGRIEDYIGTTAPQGWLAMNGQAVLNADTTYPNLWAVPGLPGKSGTTLTLPDTRGRMSVGYTTGDASFDVIGETGGAKTHTLATTEIPAHTHIQDSHGHTSPAHGHSWHGVNNTAGVTPQGGIYPFRINEDIAMNWPGTTSMIDNTAVGINGTTATNQNTGGGQAHNNMPPYITFLKIIRAY